MKDESVGVALSCRRGQRGQLGNLAPGLPIHVLFGIGITVTGTNLLGCQSTAGALLITREALEESAISLGVA